MIGTQNFGKSLEPGLKVIYGQEYDRYPPIHPEVFDVQTSTKAFEESLSLTGFGQVPVKTQGKSVSFVDPKQNWVHRLTHITYGLGYSISREMYEDDQYGKIRKFTQSLAVSVADTREALPADVLNNGFVTTVRTGGDGLELLSTAHLLGGGGTYKNELTVAADLTATSFEQALIDIGDIVDDAGILMHLKPKKLIVPNELDWTATKLLESTLDPDSANGAVNPAKSRIPYVVWNYLTDPDAWFITTTAMNGLVVYNRWMPEYTRDNDWDSENAKFKTIFRCVSGWDDPRGIFGSPGA